MMTEETKKKNSKNKTHVLAFPVPGQGHISPMMHLCKRIAAQEDFTVSFLNVDSLHQEMAKFWTPPKNLDIRLVSIPFSWKVPYGLDANALGNLGAFFRTTLEMVPVLEELIQKLSQEISPVRCIISDFFLFWTQDVANRIGIPRIILWPGSAAWTSLEYHIPQLVEGNHIFPSLNRGLCFCREETCRERCRGGFRPRSRPASSIRHSSLSYINQASRILVNSFYDLEPEVFDFMRSELGDKYVPIGPMFLLDDAEDIGPTNVVLRSEDDRCMEWLDRQEHASVLYISFGSIAVLSVEQFEELAAALESSKKPFLWVIRGELIAGGAQEELYRSFCERTKDQGFVVAWAPQLKVLGHAAIAAFLTHCGWNSILESICHAVPLLLWPWGAEQNSNCKFAADDWKIGTRLTQGASGLFDRHEIQAKIKTVMEDEEGKQMKAKIETLQRKGRAAVEENGLSKKNLQDFMDYLRGGIKP